MREWTDVEHRGRCKFSGGVLFSPLSFTVSTTVQIIDLLQIYMNFLKEDHARINDDCVSLTKDYN